MVGYRLVSRLCPVCKGFLEVKINTHSPDDISDYNWKTRQVFCPQCKWTANSNLSETVGLNAEVGIEMIVKPPLDYLRFLRKGYQTDLRNIYWKNRPWGYLVGRIFPTSHSHLDMESYRIAVYTLLYPPIHMIFNGNLEWQWELDERDPARIAGKPIIRPKAGGIWVKIVNVGYAYFVLVIKSRNYYKCLNKTYNSKFPFEKLEGVILTKLIWTKEVFRLRKY